jgi:hypothetical protein
MARINLITKRPQDWHPDQDRESFSVEFNLNERESCKMYPFIHYAIDNA